MGKRGYSAAYALMGVASITGQVLAIRGLMYALRGNELSLAVSLGVWLVSVGLASSLGGRLLGGLRSRMGDGRVLGIMPAWLSGIGLCVPAVVLIPRLLPGMMGFGSGELLPAWAALLLIVVTIVAVTPLIGTLFPICVVSADGGTEAAASVYTLEAFGYFAAGLVLTFILFGRLTPLQIAGLTGLVLCAGALWLLYGYWRERPSYPAAVFGFSVLVLCVFIIAWANPLELTTLNAGRDAGKVVDARWSRYGVVTVVELSGQHSVFENGAYAFSVPEPASVQKDAHMEMLVHPHPSDVLMVGGGGGMAKEALKHPVERLDYVELDPAMIKVYEDYAGPLTDPRLHVMHMDGRRYIKSKRSAYDIVMVNLTEPTTASVNRYYTVEFFGEAKAALKPGGVLSISLPSSEGYIGSEKAALLGSVLVTLREAFRYVGVTPGGTAHFFASDTEPVDRLDPAVLEARFDARRIHSAGFGREDIAFALMPGERDMVMRRIEAAGGYVNRDFRPLAYLYSLGLWGEMSGLPMFERISSLVSEGHRLMYRLGTPLFVVFALLVFFRRRSRPAGAFYAVAATGFTGMTVEVSSLLAYQSYYGYLYDMLGALMAAFMLGLYAGGRLGRRLVSSGGFRPWHLVGVDLLVLSVAAGLGALAAGPPVRGFGAAIFGIILLCGMLTGSEYPLSLELATKGADGPGHAGYPGIIYGLDLMGAGVGAVLAGLLLVPLLGIAYAALYVVILKVTSVLFLAIAARRQSSPR